MNIEGIIEQHGLVDAGWCASRWGGIDRQVTCQTAEISVGSRIDYICVCPSIDRYVRNVRVFSNDQIPTHAAMQLDIEGEEGKTVLVRLLRARM